MKLSSHIIQSAITTAILYRWLGAAYSAVLFLSIILIDVDHYLDFAIVCRRFGVRDMFKFHNWVWEQCVDKKVYGLSVFHTIEVFIALFFAGFYYEPLWVVLAGFLMHMAADMIFLYGNDRLFERAYSLVEYIVRRRSSERGYPVPDEGFWK